MAGVATVPASPATVTLGSTSQASETVTVPVVATKGSGEPDSVYTTRLSGFDKESLAGEALVAATTGVGPIVAIPADINTTEHVPILTVSIAGPSQVKGGSPAIFTVTLTNQGSAQAEGIAVTASAAGLTSTVSGTPSPLAPGESAQATVTVDTATTTTPGPVTLSVFVTWRDANGNAYGPVGASATLVVVKPVLLTLTAPSSSSGVGASQTVTATLSGVTDASGVTVTFTVNGANSGTGTAKTDSNGVAAFTYTGAVAGTDEVTATATVNGTSLKSNAVYVTWSPIANSSIATVVEGPPFSLSQLPPPSPSLWVQPLPVGPPPAPPTSSSADAVDPPYTSTDTGLRPVTGFPGTDYNGSQIFASQAGSPPPDVSLAVSTTCVVQVVQDVITITPRTPGAPDCTPSTGANPPRTLNQIFQNAFPTGESIGDPRIVYDAGAHRWFLAAINSDLISGSGTMATFVSTVVLAVSSDNNPADWSGITYELAQITEAPGAVGFDGPHSIGISDGTPDDGKIVVAWNVGNAKSDGSDVLVLNKNDVISSSTSPHEACFVSSMSSSSPLSGPSLDPCNNSTSGSNCPNPAGSRGIVKTCGCVPVR